MLRIDTVWITASIKIAFVAAFAAIAGYGVYANQKSEVLSDLTLANVEALAGSGETTIECCLALWGTCKGDIKAPYVCASRWFEVWWISVI